MTSEAWPVLPHDPIQKLSPRLWRVEGALARGPLRRVMAIGKMADGRLVVHNAMALEESAMKEIDAFGPIAFVLVPNGFHRIDAPRFAKRYPEAKILCPPGSRKKVEDVVRVDGAYADLPADPHVSLALLEGVAEAEGIMTVRDEDGATLVVNDAIFNMPHPGGVSGFVMRHVFASSGGPRISRLGKWLLVKDAAKFRAHLERLAETPDLRRIVVSHHETIAENPAKVLREVASAL